MSKKYLDFLTKNPTSAQDVFQMVDGEANIIIGDDILKYHTIEQLLGPFDRAFIMYMHNDNYGHWTAIARYKNNIQVFDSYGKYPDDYNAEFGTGISDHVTKLLLDSPYDIHYNDNEFQAGGNIATCGLWASLFLIFGREMSIDSFIDMFKGLRDDQLVRLFYKI